MKNSIFFVFSIDYQLMSHRRPVVERALQEGFDVTVVAHDTGFRDEIERMGCRFIELPVNRIGKNPIEELHTLWFLYRLYQREKPDIVHHISFKIALWGGLAAKLARVRCVVNAINGLGIFFQSGEIDTFLKRIFMRILHFSNSRKGVSFIFQNDEDIQLFLWNQAITPEQYIKIDGSGVDLELYSYEPLPERDPKIIIFTSRMLRNKGVEDVIEAANILRPRWEGKIEFWLCGLLEESSNGISKEYLDRECDGKYIKYLGQCSNVNELLRAATISILPSYYREGIPKSLIEAAAIGRPIITTDSVGCRETVEDGVNGYLVPIKSPDAIANRIEACLSDRSNLEAMGLASRRLAEQKFSVDRVLDAHFKLYSYLLDVTDIPDGMRLWEHAIKFFFDRMTAFLLLILFLPLMLFCCLMIKREDGGPVIYSQERIGMYGRPFRIYKFRSMRVDAECEGPRLSRVHVVEDSRITRSGRFFRTHHLDELPQLWNVLKGDMSFIGYRPERKFFIDKITEHDPRYSYLYSIRPGVTSYATLYNGYTDSMEKMLRRLELDLEYLKHRSLFFDIKVLWLTFYSIVSGKRF